MVRTMHQFTSRSASRSCSDGQHKQWRAHSDGCRARIARYSRGESAGPPDDTTSTSSSFRRREYESGVSRRDSRDGSSSFSRARHAKVERPRASVLRGVVPELFHARLLRRAEVCHAFSPDFVVGIHHALAAWRAYRAPPATRTTSVRAPSPAQHGRGSESRSSVRQAGDMRVVRRGVRASTARLVFSALEHGCRRHNRETALAREYGRMTPASGGTAAVD